MTQPDDPTLEEKSLGELLRELRDDTATLIKQEMRLALSELSQKASFVSKSAAAIVAGGLGVLVGLVFLLSALAIGLAVAWNERLGAMAYWMGPLVVGLVTLVVGGTFAWRGYRILRRGNLAPLKTIESMKETKQWLSQQTAQ